MIYSAQNELWNKIKTCLKNPNDVTPSTVLSLLVKDPRLVLPKKKSFNKVYDQYKKINCFSKDKIDNG